MPHALSVVVVLVVAALVAVAAGVWLRVVRYAPYFSFDADQDVRYPLPGAASLPVTIDAGEEGTSFVWPEAEGPFDTALLEVKLACSKLGRVLDPSVEATLAGSDARTVQYLVRGTDGVRYVNLSALARRRPAPGARVRLSGRNATVAPGAATLHLMRSPGAAQGPVLVVAPHPDDAELSSFGLYAARAQGHAAADASDAWVVTVTAGEVGTFGHPYGGLLGDGVEASRTRGRLRVWESLTAPFVGRVPAEHAMNLGYFDGTVEAMRRAPDTAVRSSAADVDSIDAFRRYNRPGVTPPSPERATWRGLVADLAAVLARAHPSVIVAPHPMLDVHSDHVAVGLAVMEAIERAGLTDGTLLLYVIHDKGSGPYGSLQPVGPRDGVVSLPPARFDAPIADRIYSSPVSTEQRRMKLFALDAFRDLRSVQTGLTPSVPAAVTAALRDVYRRLVVPDASFYRRAVRPNELFFVIDLEEVPAYRAQFEREAG
ncbi:MAG: PIG-L family deacetylase [Myxococcales bacterium]|nr:PIG-L family deacetylase [Myxococcales bacterium]